MNLVDRTENFKNMSLVIEGFKIRNLIDKGYLTEYRIKKLPRRNGELNKCLRSDHFSALFGQCHNIGAGGVDRDGAIISPPCRHKRWLQMLNRSIRATGGRG